MNADWKPGGPLLTAWVQVRLATAACAPGDLVTRPIMVKALCAAQQALEIARMKAIKEDEMSQSEDQWCGDRPGEEDSNVVEG